MTPGKFFLEPSYPYPPGLSQTRILGEPVMALLETLVARQDAFMQVGLFAPDDLEIDV